MYLLARPTANSLRALAKARTCKQAAARSLLTRGPEKGQDADFSHADLESTERKHIEPTPWISVTLPLKPASGMFPRSGMTHHDGELSQEQEGFLRGRCLPETGTHIQIRAEVPSPWPPSSPGMADPQSKGSEWPAGPTQMAAAGSIDLQRKGRIPEQPVGIRVYTDGSSKDSKQSALGWLVAVITISLYTSWLNILYALIFGMLFSRTCVVVFWTLVATLLLPAKPVLWNAVLCSPLFATWRRYFNFSYLQEAPLDPSKRYILAQFPHAVFPLSQLVGGTAAESQCPDWNIYTLAADSVFYVPLWKQFVAWLGAVPANSRSFKDALSKGSVSVIVGGIAEMYMQHPDKERIKLKTRKGFVRIAVEAGIDGGILPIYHFGNTQLFSVWPKNPQHLAKLQHLSRRVRAALGQHYGRWGLPIPRQVPLYMVTGKPIPVPKLPRDHPEFEATVERVHQQVVQAVRKLYEDHRWEYGWQDRPLEIE